MVSIVISLRPGSRASGAARWNDEPHVTDGPGLPRTQVRLLEQERRDGQRGGKVFVRARDPGTEHVRGGRDGFIRRLIDNVAGPHTTKYTPP